MRADALDRADRLYLLGVGSGLLVVTLLGPLERRLELVNINDFSGVWAGARAVVLGGIDPYSPGWPEWARRLEAQVPNTVVYGYMPWVVLALLPFGLLPLGPAAWIWMIAGITAAVLGLRALLRAFLPGRPILHAFAGLALLVSQPAVHSLVLGQWSFLLLGATALGVLGLRAGRPAPGAALAVFLAKPQLFVLGGLGLLREGLARGRPGRAFVGLATATAAAVVLAGWLAFPQWLAAFLTHVVPVRLERSASLSSALGDLLGAAGPAVALAAIGLMTLSALAVRAGTDEALAVWLALSLAAAPYLWSYDHLVLLTPLVIAAGALSRRDPRAGGRLLVAGLAALVLFSPVLYGVAVARGRESFSALVPLLFFVSIAVALWPARRGTGA